MNAMHRHALSVLLALSECRESCAACHTCGPIICLSFCSLGNPAVLKLLEGLHGK